MNRAWVVCGMVLVACGSSTPGGGGGGPDGGGGGGGGTVRLDADIGTSQTLRADTLYVIPANKQLFVRPGATLTVEAGTTVQGEQGALLVVARGARILANGTAAKPILMTSAQPAGQKTPGFWGGLLVMGAAPVNTNVNASAPSDEATYEAFAAGQADAKFGGQSPADDSGSLRYVRIEFAGAASVTDRRYSGLTLAGVGSGTIVDYVQVHAGAEDGLELIGGTVNMKHLVLTQNADDGMDVTDGWTGKAQFVVVQDVRHPASIPEASNGYEFDNHGTSTSYTAAPRTRPTIYNATLVGDHAYAGGSSYAALLRRGAGARLYNHVWVGFPRGPELRDAPTADQIATGDLVVRYSMLFGNDASASNLPPAQASADIDETLVFNATENVTLGLDPGLPASALSPTAPSFAPNAGAAALTGGATPPGDGFFDPTATFRGAVGMTDWTAGWTAYPQS